MDAEAEKTLIERAQCGDPLAYQELFKFYWLRIFRTVNYILKDDADAEDVVQDVFLKVYGALGTFRHQSSFFTWLYKIAVNAARSSLIAKARNARVMTDDDEATIENAYSSEDDQPEVMHSRVELARMLDVVITALPSSLREAFLLREIDDLSYAEIAELTHSPVGTVKSRVSRAKSYLADHIAEYEADMPLAHPELAKRSHPESRSSRT